jgi:hypothetical protein
MKCNGCDTTCSCMVLYCPGCGAELYDVAAQDGQLVARRRSGGEGGLYFAVLSGEEHTPVVVRGALVGSGNLDLTVLRDGQEAQVQLAIADLLRASADRREWVQVGS